ncbi:hypothetical protein BJ546DRAFT_834604, partial [Cryomyces antarcticus]
TQLASAQRRASLTALIRTYVSVIAGDVSITTWLAHDTLPSWHWKQHLFPWETDADAHV